MSMRSILPLLLGYSSAVIAAGALFEAFAQTPPIPLQACVNRAGGVVKIITQGEQCHYGWELVQLNAPGTQVPPALPQVQYIGAQMYPGTQVSRAFCPAGTKLVGGGGLSISGAGLAQNHPIGDLTGVVASGTTGIGWQVAATDWSAVQAYAICMGP